MFLIVYLYSFNVSILNLSSINSKQLCKSYLGGNIICFRPIILIFEEIAHRIAMQNTYVSKRSNFDRDNFSDDYPACFSVK